MFFIIVATTILAFLLARQYRKASKLPPGPTSLPLIGNLHQVIYQVWKSGGIVPMFTKYRETYGNVFTLWFGPFPHVSICDFETAHEVFVKNGTKYPDRFISPIIGHVRNGKGVFASNGENWQELRKFSMTTMRNMGMGKDLMEQKVLDELDARCAEIDKKAVNGVTTENANSFFDLTVGSIINNILVGERFDEHNKHDFLTLKHMLDKSMESLTMIDMISPVWILEKFFSKQFKFHIDMQEKVASYVSRKALERKESLKCLLLDLWITGQETTTTTLISGFTQFMSNPEEMEKVRDELLKVTNGGARPLSLKDKNDTPYYNATLNEIQRHASILNINFWRINHELTTMGGYPVDSGALVTAQLSALHANDSVFENSHKFDPTRFIKNEKLGQQIIPFGIGKRSCLGESLARAELYLIIGNLLLRYKFWPHGEAPSTADVSPFGFAKRPQQLDIDFIKI